MLAICFSFTPKLPTDYRDVYVGNYFCTENCQTVNSDKTGTVSNTTMLTISVSKDPADSVINVNIRNVLYKAKIENGKLFAYPKGHWSGKLFSSDSLRFVISTSHIMNICGYSGKKQ